MTKIIILIKTICEKIATSTVAAMIKDWIFGRHKKKKVQDPQQQPEAPAPISNKPDRFIEQKIVKKELRINKFTFYFSSSSSTFRNL